MAKKKHRKLFPSLASETNKTLDCSLGICDPICPYNCNREPDYYTISPQLAPWSSPSPSPCPSISAIYQPSQKPSSPLDAINIIIATGAVLAILLTGFFVVAIAKYITDRVNRVNQERYQSDDNDTVEGEEFQDREQVDHPIWLIRTTGLQQSIINSITICNYKRGDGLIERTDCPICLNEFEEDESLRLLPKCNHAFHISCIDTWLKSHTNCPLCRAGITINVATPRCSGPVDIITPEGGSGSRLENDGVGEEGQIENRVELGRERDDSDNTDTNSDVRIEIYGVGNEINSDVRIQSQELTRPIGDEASCSEENGSHNIRSRRSFDSIGSGEMNGEVTEDAGKVQSDISSNTLKTTGSSSVSRFNKSKSSIFPL